MKKKIKQCHHCWLWTKSTDDYGATEGGATRGESNGDIRIWIFYKVKFSSKKHEKYQHQQLISFDFNKMEIRNEKLPKSPPT